MALSLDSKKQILHAYLSVPAASLSGILNDVSDPPSLNQDCPLTRLTFPGRAL
jgi:hypothetical protein